MTKKNTAIKCLVTEVSEIEDSKEWEQVLLNNTYQVVVKKGSLKEGDQKIFVPSGSWIPNDALPFDDPKDYKGIKGGYLPLNRNQGVWSEGLVFDVDGEVNNFEFKQWQRELPKEFESNSDYCKTFPRFLASPELVEAQDIADDIFTKYSDHKFEITPLFDGITIIAYINDGRFGVCSGKYDIQEVNGNDPIWKVVYENQLQKVMSEYSDTNFAIYATLVGSNIYTNVDKLQERKLFVYDIYRISERSFLHNTDRYNMFVEMAENTNCDHVPVFDRLNIKSDIGDNIRDLIEYSDGTSMNPYSKRKGLVFKSLEDPNVRFKVTSPMFRFSNKL